MDYENGFQTNVFLNLPEAYILLDRHFNVIAASNQWLKLTELTLEYVQGKYLFDLFPDNPNSKTFVVEQSKGYLNKVIDTKEIVQWPIIKYDIPLRKNNELNFVERFWSTISIPILDRKYEVEYILHRTEDITEFMGLKSSLPAGEAFMKPIPLNAKEMLAEVIEHARAIQDINNQLEEANEKLKEQEIINAHFTSIVKSSNDAIISYCNAGNVLSWNQGAEILFGYTSQDAIGQHISFIFPKTSRDNFKDLSIDIFTKKNVIFENMEILHKSGKRIPVSIGFSIITDKENKTIGGCSIARDISTTLAHQELIQLQKESIKMLSTPVLQIKDELLLQPLVGIFDEARILQLRKSLLSAINAKRAKVVVLDITGLLSIDKSVTKLLIDTIDAARLMGAVIIITGISNELANTLIALEINLSKFIAVGDLQKGIIVGEEIINNKHLRDTIDVEEDETESEEEYV